MAPDDSDDEKQLALAIALSLQHNGTSADSTTNSAASRGIPGLDRKQMEAERLARCVSRKRQRTSISPPAMANARKSLRIEEKPVDLSSGARLNMIVAQEVSSQLSAVAKSRDTLSSVNDTIPLSATTNKVKISDDILYPHGVIKKTWAFGHVRMGDDVKIEEVLEPLTLNIAVLSAFQWDTDWIRAKLKTPENGGQTKCIFVMHAKEQSLREQILQDTKDLMFLKVCFPPMDGQIHCMHSKLMLLFHDRKLRIAIPTANLRNFDWGETGEMENSVFMIDLPRRDNHNLQTPESLTFFGRELYYFMEKQGFPEMVLDGVLKFDFVATNNMAFIHAVGGSSLAEEAERTGTPGLGRAIRELGLRADQLQLDFAASSIGSLNDDQLQTLHDAARGEDVLKAFIESRRAKQRDFFKSAKTNASAESISRIRDQMRIYFPTYQTVTSSKAGGAGTICLSRTWFESATFPRSVFRDYQSKRPGLLSHNKILYGRGKFRGGLNEPAKSRAWLYLGSANMSESAWGKISEERSKKACKIQCRNWECGVLISVSHTSLNQNDNHTVKTARSQRVSENGAVIKEEDSETESENPERDDNDSETEDEAEDEIDKQGSQPNANEPPNEDENLGVDMHVFDHVLPTPFSYPGRTYGEREPWYFKEAMMR